MSIVEQYLENGRIMATKGGKEEEAACTRNTELIRNATDDQLKEIAETGMVYGDDFESRYTNLRKCRESLRSEIKNNLK